MAKIDTFEACPAAKDDLVPSFLQMVDDDSPRRRPPKEQMDYWIYYDDRSFSEPTGGLVPRSPINGEPLRATGLGRRD